MAHIRTTTLRFNPTAFFISMAQFCIAYAYAFATHGYLSIGIIVAMIQINVS